MKITSKTTASDLLRDIEANKLDDWTRLIKRIIKEVYFPRTCDVTLSYEDVEQEAWVLLCLAAKKFDPEKAKATQSTFQTYAFQCVRWGLLRVVVSNNRKFKKQSDAEIDVLANLLSIPPSQIRTTESLDMISYTTGNMNPQELDLLYRYYVAGQSYREIASEVGDEHQTAKGEQPTYQTIKNRLDDAVAKMRSKMRLLKHEIN